MSDLQPQKGLIAWFVRNPVAANLLMMLIIFGGVMNVFRIEKKTFPEMRPDHIYVEVAFPQASPEEVERGVIVKIEEAIEEVEGIDRVVSTAYEGFAFVRVEVATGQPLSQVMDEVSYEVNGIFTFPEEAETPILRRADLEEDDIIVVQITGDLDEKALTETLETVREELLLLPGVSQATIQDARDYEISIEVSEDVLRRHGLTFEEVAMAVRANSFDLGGGTIRTQGSDLRVRTRAQAYVGSDFKGIPLRRSEDGAELTVGDVARVVDGFVEDGKYPRFDGKPTVSMVVKAALGESDLAVAAAVREFVDKKNQELPESVQLEYWADASPYLVGRINLMLHNLGVGAILVFILLMFFLQIRLAFWVIVGIPVAFGGALFLMPLFDTTVNMISLFGFILVLGIVVDDAIVIAENIHSHVQRDGAGADVVIRGAKEVAIPATFGVLTTIVAFIPMTLVTGTFGPIWMAIGIVVILALVFSLVESKWILPVHLLHLKPENPDTKGNLLDRPRLAVDRGLKGFIERVYKPILRKALEFRYATIALFFTLAFLSISLVAAGAVRFVFFPALPSDFLFSKLQMAPGTPIDVTLTEMEKIEEALFRLDQRLVNEGNASQVKHIRTRLEDRSSGEILVELTKSENRTMDAYEFAELWSKEVGQIAGADAFTVDASIAATGGADIEIELAGQDVAQIKAAGEALKRRLMEYEGVYNVRNRLSDGNPELHLSLRPEAESRGLTLNSVARQMRQGFYGAEAQRVQRGTNEVKVMVRYPETDRRSIYDLRNTRLRTPDGAEIPFSQAVDIDFVEGYSELERADGLRVARITATANKQIAEPGKIASQLLKTFPKEVLSKQFPDVQMRRAGQSEQEVESLTELLYGFIFAIICIYGLMAIPLRSYIQPLLIMTAIPFGFIGAVVGHLILSLPISVLSLCGVIALAGVVVNDSLVFVDYVNRRRREGLSAEEAAFEAGPARFRAILLTSLTTFVGLMPIIAERSLQAKIVIPMAVTLAFGILFATLITLILLPTLYLVPEDIRKLLKRKKPHQESIGAEPETS
ncbi:MAG: efflux RND transporter permease subunit [Verrucomicrobiota bacterium]